jgi:hypothetical protein
MTTALLTRPSDLERAIADLSALAKQHEPGPFENGLLCSLTVLTRVRDGYEDPVDATGLDYAMIRMNGFSPE